MGFFSWLADRMIFEASTDHIDAEERTRKIIEFNGGSFESWLISNVDSEGSDNTIFALKFPGTGGRAERGGPHPAEIIASDNHEIWTINPPGYGTSGGKPSLKTIVAVCDAAWNAFSQRANSRPKIVVGNSLGCMYALYVAARYPLDGIFIRNPVPLREIIIGRYSWWNFGIGSRMVTQQIPPEMNSIQNAAQCRAPAFIVVSQRDRVIPPEYQQQIIDSYAGDQHVFVVRDADHHEPVPEDQWDEYETAISNFGIQIRSKNNG